MLCPLCTKEFDVTSFRRENFEDGREQLIEELVCENCSLEATIEYVPEHPSDYVIPYTALHIPSMNVTE